MAEDQEVPALEEKAQLMLVLVNMVNIHQRAEDEHLNGIVKILNIKALVRIFEVK